MAIDIEWVGVVDGYLKTGDIRPLANLVRKGEIPEECRADVAKILLGELPTDRRGEHATSARLESVYRSAISHAISHARFMHGLEHQLKLAHYSGPLKQRQYDMKWVKRIVAKECFSGNYESARRVINRKLKRGWPALPE